MIDAADLLALHPTGMQHRQPVGAAAGDEVSPSALAAIEGEIFAHDAQRPRAASLDAM